MATPADPGPISSHVKPSMKLACSSPPAPAPEETAAAPVLGKKRTSQQTPTKKKAENAVTSRTGTAAVISRRRLGTSSLRIPLLTDLNTPV